MTFRPPPPIHTSHGDTTSMGDGATQSQVRSLPQSQELDSITAGTTMTGQGSVDVDNRATDQLPNRQPQRRHHHQQQNRQHHQHHYQASSHHRHNPSREQQPSNPDETEGRRRPESSYSASTASAHNEQGSSSVPDSSQNYGSSLSNRRRSSGLTRLSINSSVTSTSVPSVSESSAVTAAVAISAAPTPRAAPYRDEMASLMVTRRRGNNNSVNNNYHIDEPVIETEERTGIVVSTSPEDIDEIEETGASHPVTTRHMAIAHEHVRHFVDDDDDEDDEDLMDDIEREAVPDTADNSADGSAGMGGSGSITDEDLMHIDDPPGTKDEEAEKNFHLSSTSLVSHSSSPSPVSSSSVVIIPRGYRLRDEFVCPITREVMVDPVMAADGHTYDRMALERWLLANSTSPKTGQPLEHLHLTPNHNLHRLLNDLFREGGQALWIRESDDLPYTIATAMVQSGDNGRNLEERIESFSDEPQVALVLERVLKCKCLGPAESDWMGRTFRVTSQGVSGGRRRFTDTSTPSASSANQCFQEGGVVMKKEFVQFSDATVSRKHFDISFEKENNNKEDFINKRKNETHNKMVAGKFVLRDLGSAGGTFVRIPPWQPTVLKAGMRIMVGKHQLEVLSPPPRTNNSHQGRRRKRTSTGSCHGPKGDSNHSTKVGGIDSSSTPNIPVTAATRGTGAHHTRANTGVSVLSLPQVTSVASTVSSNNGGDLGEGIMDESNLVALHEYEQQQQERDASTDQRHRRDSSSVAAAVAASGCGCTSSGTSNNSGISSSSPTSGGGSSTRRNSQDYQHTSSSNHSTTRANKRGSSNNNSSASPLEEITSRTDVNTPKYTADTAAIAAMMSRFEFCGSGGASGTESASIPSSPIDALSAADRATAAVAAASLNDQHLQHQTRQGPDVNRQDLASITRENGRLQRGKTTRTTPRVACNENNDSGCTDGEEENNENLAQSCEQGEEEGDNDDEPLLILRCYAPEGTPIQGREYPLGRKGATLGRKAQNTISFSHTVKQVVSVPTTTVTGDGAAESQEHEEREQVVENIVGIDSSISGEHATILYNPKTQQLELQDGACPPSRAGENGNKNRRGNHNSSNAVGSTNGTWVRLSGMHEESQPFALEDNATEILIGTVRFLVTLEDAIVERDYYSHCK